MDAQITGENPPDIVRHTEPGRYRDMYLDLRPYLENPEDWDANFPAPLLAAMRPDPTSNTLHGYPTEITVSAPYINRTLFERAGVAVPSDSGEQVSWETWTDATAQVQANLAEQGEQVYGIVMDRSGHRFWGYSLGQCASYLNDAGEFTVDSEGFRTSAEMLRQWHIDGLTPLDVWGAMGDSYIEPRDMFMESEVVFYYSGSWVIPYLAESVGDRFEWEPVPNPGLPCGASGMVGGGILAAFKSTQYPEAVGALMSYLTTEENLTRFYTENSLLPGHSGIVSREIAYSVNSVELNLFAQELNTLQDQAFMLQYHPDSPYFHTAIRRGLIQMIVQDLTMDETVAAIEENLLMELENE